MGTQALTIALATLVLAPGLAGVASATDPTDWLGVGPDYDCAEDPGTAAGCTTHYVDDRTALDLQRLIGPCTCDPVE